MSKKIAIIAGSGALVACSLFGGAGVTSASATVTAGTVASANVSAGVGSVGYGGGKTGVGSVGYEKHDVTSAGDNGAVLAEGSYDNVNATLDIGKGAGGVGALAQSINRATDMNILSYDSAEGIVTFDNDAYSDLDTTQRRDFMKTALPAIRTSSLNTMPKNRLYNFVADQDTTTSAALRNLETDSQADVASASTWFKPFSGVVSTVLGLIALAVFLFLAIGTVLDTAYITIPPFRIFSDKKDTKPFFITQEAYSSINDVENAAGSDAGRSTILLYFRRRALTMFAIGICLLYLISGQIIDLIMFFVDAFSPLWGD